MFPGHFEPIAIPGHHLAGATLGAEDGIQSEDESLTRYDSLIHPSVLELGLLVPQVQVEIS